MHMCPGPPAGISAAQDEVPVGGGVPGGDATPPITTLVTHHSVGLHALPPHGTGAPFGGAASVPGERAVADGLAGGGAVGEHAIARSTATIERFAIPRR